MPFKEINIKKIVFSAALFLLIFFGAIFVFLLGPRDSSAVGETVDFIVEYGDGFSEITDLLEKKKIIKSKIAFEALAVFNGAAAKLKPGWYQFDPTKSSPEILRELVSGPHIEVSVTIPEGSSAYEIDNILYGAGVTAPGSVADFVFREKLEGRLFPDTYKFFTNSPADDVIPKFLDNFNLKTKEVLAGAEESEVDSAIVLASLLEKEVPDHEERRMVAGILKKRIKAQFPLQIDATICYIKKALRQPRQSGCYPLSSLDFKIESEYNTYLYKGLPPAPIGNPGISAIKAALEPIESPYWYYLSDPDTKRTIFAKTFEEHNENRARYLGL